MLKQAMPETLAVFALFLALSVAMVIAQAVILQAYSRKYITIVTPERKQELQDWANAPGINFFDARDRQEVLNKHLTQREVDWYKKWPKRLLKCGVVLIMLILIAMAVTAITTTEDQLISTSNTAESANP